MKIDQNAVIQAGGASGIGREILKKLITPNGVRVLVADLNPGRILKAPEAVAEAAIQGILCSLVVREAEART